MLANRDQLRFRLALKRARKILKHRGAEVTEKEEQEKSREGISLLPTIVDYSTGTTIKIRALLFLCVLCASVFQSLLLKSSFVCDLSSTCGFIHVEEKLAKLVKFPFL